METQKILISQSITEKGKKKSGGINLLYFRLYYKATVIKTVSYWERSQKYRSIEQDRKLRDKFHPLMGNLSLTKKGRIYSGEKTASSINGAGKQKMKLEHFLTPHTKINSKWSKDLTVRPETIKLLEENIGRTV